MRKFLALWAVVFFFAVPSFAAAKFVTFPGLGTCTGTYVRYRETPDTDSEIIGRLNTPERVIVLSQRTVGGDIWYEIEDPHSQAAAWIFGKYVIPVFSEKIQRTKKYSLMVDILQNYGITRDKGKFYDGPAARVRYRKGYLSFLEAGNEGCRFDTIEIGNGRDYIGETLGVPDNEDDNLLEYSLDDETKIRFFIEDDKISRMEFEN